MNTLKQLGGYLIILSLLNACGSATEGTSQGADQGSESNTSATAEQSNDTSSATNEESTQTTETVLEESVVIGNEAPVANSGRDQNQTTGTVITLDGSGSSDPDGDLLLYTWILVTGPTGSNSQLNYSDVVNPTFTPDLDGTYIWGLKVNDGTISSNQDTISVISTTSNSAPTANAGSDQNVITGSVVTLDASESSDANDQLLTYSWSFLSLPSNSDAALNNTELANPSFIADKDGTYTLQLMVHDGEIKSAGDTVTVTSTTGNATPVADAGNDQNVTTGTLVTLDGSASSDANNDQITYRWSIISLPVGSNSSLSSTNVVAPQFTPDTDGAYLFGIVVNDGFIESMRDSVLITSSTPNSAPVANAGANQNVTTETQVTLDGTGSSDADGDTITYTWSFISKPPGSGTLLDYNTATTPKFTPDVSGSYVLELVVNDGFLNSTTDTVSITSVVGNTTLTWDAPNPLGDVAGYTIHYGTSSGSYPQSVDTGLNTSYQFGAFPIGTYYFVVSSYDAAGNQSAFTEEVSKKIQ